MYRTSLAILGDPAEAQDAAQETFIAAWRALADLRVASLSRGSDPWDCLIRSDPPDRSGYVSAHATLVMSLAIGESRDRYRVSVRSAGGSVVASWRASEDSPALYGGHYTVEVASWLDPEVPSFSNHPFGGCSTEIYLEGGAGYTIAVEMRPSRRDCALTVAP